MKWEPELIQEFMVSVLSINQELDMKPFVITAASMPQLLSILYFLVIDYHESGEGKASGETKTQLTDNFKFAKDYLPVLPSLELAIKSAVSGRSKVTNLVMLGQEIKDAMPKMKKSENFSSDELTVLFRLGQYLRTDSEAAYKTIGKMASITKSTWISRKFTPEVGNQANVETQLKKLVKQMVGRDSATVTIDEAKTVKSTDPELYREYLQLRRAYNQVWQNAGVAFVRENGLRYVPYQDLLAHFEANGINHTMPLGFTGLIDDRLRWYTPGKLPIEGIPNSTTFPRVEMNDAYGASSPSVFRAVRSNGAAGPYFYTADFKKRQASAKFGNVQELGKKLPSMRNKWFAVVKKFNLESPDSIAATIIEILYQFSARVGSIGNKAAGSSTYGVSTLLVKHATVRPNGDILLSYKGKDGVATKHLIKNIGDQRFLNDAVNALLVGKDNPRQPIFQAKKGDKYIAITAAMVNRFFKQCGAPADVTVHKLRTSAGTELFQELMEKQLAKPKQPQSEKEAMVLFKAMAEAVGKKLNHVRSTASGTKITGTTAIASYIDPAVGVVFWRSLGFRPPKIYEKFDV